MDFIERLFGVSPDGGDGSTELIYLVVIVIVAAVLSWLPATRWYAARMHRKKR
ncbi:MAG TPA: hypothetical protein VNZ48_21165 [Xanthobacteraceae bacterium]|jgi:hypothetical protein|nr:hypothetical protein [Xanthobacteraceae bacterium]